MMGRLADSGLLTYWYEFYKNPSGLKLQIEEIGPQVLTMEHLLIGFQICIAVLTLSVIAFVAEMTIKCSKKVSSRIKSRIYQTMFKILKPKLQKYRMRKMKACSGNNNSCQLMTTKLVQVKRSRAITKTKIERQAVRFIKVEPSKSSK